jgi:hypothetical protein
MISTGLRFCLNMKAIPWPSLNEEMKCKRIGAN